MLLASVRSGQRDSRRRRQADDDFGRWVKTTGPILGGKYP